jgi:hypothetical protein
METRLDVHIQYQPDDTTCGPTCLHAVYRYFGEDISLDQVLREVSRLEHGGTLAVLLANHALGRGYGARLYTYNLGLFDPTWFGDAVVDLAERLRLQSVAKPRDKAHVQTDAYLEFLAAGGVVRMEEPTAALLRRHLKRGHPILSGLSATWLYRQMRELESDCTGDDVAGTPVGHFVLLCGYDSETRRVLVADPMRENPVSAEPVYAVEIDRLVTALLLGTMTYDGNLLVLTPPEPEEEA